MPTRPLRVLKNIRIVSLALNLPGPAALMQCRLMGAHCVKFEPPSADPMRHYSPAAYAALHQGVRCTTADLKTDKGQQAVHRELASADVLLTSFRPSALTKLGLSWPVLHKQYPGLSQVAMVGSTGAQAELAGHDLTYLAENDLITGLDLPATLYADMGGALLATQAVLQLMMHKAQTGKGARVEVALAQAAAYLALPRVWGLTKTGADIGGGHAGYAVYPCKDGRVALAALEPHFARRLCLAAGLPETTDMRTPASARNIALWLQDKTRQQLNSLAAAQDIPLHTLVKHG